MKVKRKRFWLGPARVSVITVCCSALPELFEDGNERVVWKRLFPVQICPAAMFQPTKFNVSRVGQPQRNQGLVVQRTTKVIQD